MAAGFTRAIRSCPAKARLLGGQAGLYILCFFASLPPVFATTLTGTFKDAAGNPVRGSLTLTLSQPAVNPSSPNQVVPTTVTCNIKLDGTLDTCVVLGNDVLLPAGTYYTARLYDSNKRQIWEQKWVIQGATLDVGTLTPATTTTPYYPNNFIYSDPAPASLTSQKINTHLTPNSANARDLGSAALPWRSAYVGSLTAVGGAVFAPNINNVRYCKEHSGADAGAKIIACIAELPATGGVADARGFEGNQSFATSLVISKPVELLLGRATFALGTNQILIKSSGVKIRGIGKTAGYLTGVTRFSYAGAGPAMILASDIDEPLFGITLADFEITAVGAAVTSATARGIELRGTRYTTLQNIAVDEFQAGRCLNFTGTATQAGGTNILINPFLSACAIGLKASSEAGAAATHGLIFGGTIGGGLDPPLSQVGLDLSNETWRVFGTDISYNWQVGSTAVLLHSGAFGTVLDGVRFESVYDAITIEAGVIGTQIISPNFYDVRHAKISDSSTDTIYVTNDPTLGSRLGDLTVTKRIASDASTTPRDFIELLMAQPGAAGRRNSHSILQRGTSFDTAGHNIDWKFFVEPQTNAGDYSILRFQSRLDGGAFTNAAGFDNFGSIIGSYLDLSGGNAVIHQNTADALIVGDGRSADSFIVGNMASGPYDLLTLQYQAVTKFTVTNAGTAQFAGGLNAAKAVIAGVNVVSFSATPTFDASLGNTQKITLTGNVTSSTLSNASAGQPLEFILCQDATGGRTFVWPANVKGGMTIGVTPSKCSAQNFIFDGTTAYATSSGVIDM